MNTTCSYRRITTGSRRRISFSAAHVHELQALHEEFPLVPLHILNQVFEAYLRVAATTDEALESARIRVRDALAPEGLAS